MIKQAAHTVSCIPDKAKTQTKVTKAKSPNLLQENILDITNHIYVPNSQI